MKTFTKALKEIKPTIDARQPLPRGYEPIATADNADIDAANDCGDRVINFYGLGGDFPSPNVEIYLEGAPWIPGDDNCDGEWTSELLVTLPQDEAREYWETLNR